MTIEQFIASFNARLDRVACLGFDDNVKGHLLLELSGLAEHDQNLIVASSGGDYDVKKISSALRSAYQHLDLSDSSMHSPMFHPS